MQEKEVSNDNQNKAEEELKRVFTLANHLIRAGKSYMNYAQAEIAYGNIIKAIMNWHRKARTEQLGEIKETIEREFSIYEKSGMSGMIAIGNHLDVLEDILRMLKRIDERLGVNPKIGEGK